MTVPQQLAPLPNSAKLVYQELVYQDELCYTDLRDELKMADSSLSFALDELQQRGAIEKESDSGPYRPLNFNNGR